MQLSILRNHKATSSTHRLHLSLKPHPPVAGPIPQNLISCPYTNMSNPRSFSIHGQGLKLNSRADIEPHLKVLREMKDVEEVHFGGNTLGVEASEALAEVLSDLKSLKVSYS